MSLVSILLFLITGIFKSAVLKVGGAGYSNG
jgi:hypothetical protein